MPLAALRPSLPVASPVSVSSTAALGSGGGGGSVVSRVGARVRKEGEFDSFHRTSHHHHQQQQGCRANATMLPNLRRCGGRAVFWERTVRATATRSFEKSIMAGILVQRLRLGVVSYEHLSFGARVGNSYYSSNSNAAGSNARCGGASTSGFDSGVVEASPIIGHSNTLGDCQGCNGLSGRFRSFKTYSLGGYRQVSFGWKRRERNDEYESRSSGWTGENTVNRWHHPKRVYTAASLADAAVARNVSEAALRKGALLEFERESGKILLAVAQNKEGKKNWAAIDQSGNMHIVRPAQITYVVPNPDDFEPSDIAKFLGKVEHLQDLGLLEFAWEEVLAENVTQVQAESLAKILYSQDSPVECYTVHRMLSGNQIFFRCKQKGLTPVYEPRSLPQVRELQQKRVAEEKAHEQLLSYVKAIKLAFKCPQSDKPAESKWHEDRYFHDRTESLKAYALSPRPDPAQKKYAEEVIDIMGLSKNPAVAVNLLIGIGVFPLHVNVDLLKMKNLVEFTKEHIAAVEHLYETPPIDPDLDNRVDLTAMKVYTIDSDDTDEIDDGLSAARLPDGRIKVWIHVADPTRWLQQDDVLTREAETRGTSIYLPTGTIPMFPMELAAGQMSLRQGQNCCAVTVAVVLNGDGSIAEYSVMNSTICPTYKLSYDNVAELLLMYVDEEPELYLLAEAANCRAKWRTSQGAILSNMPEPEIKVRDPDSIEPSIILEVKDQSTPAMQLVAEMMILCGEAISTVGEENSLCLPYRGQAQSDFPTRVIGNLPEGPCRAFAMRRLLGSADMSFKRAIPHASLGLPGYVQFTSPIRRFSDLISHYQVKALLRGDVPPFSAGKVEAKMATANIRSKDARKLQTSSVRYWTIEYLRRQPKERKYPAVVLQCKKDGEVSVLLLEVGFRCSVILPTTPSVGSEINVVVFSADPRKDSIIVRQC
ncbi:unnamed protein product [Calypogeia fissa]